jgi:hypothetical protein
MQVTGTDPRCGSPQVKMDVVGGKGKPKGQNASKAIAKGKKRRDDAFTKVRAPPPGRSNQTSAANGFKASSFISNHSR